MTYENIRTFGHKLRICVCYMYMYVRTVVWEIFVEKFFVLKYFRGLGATTKIYTRYVITLRNRGLRKGYLCVRGFHESEPFGSGKPSLRCRYRSRAILAALSCVAFTYIRRLYNVLLFVVKIF